MDVKQLTKIVIAWELFEEGLPKSHIAEQLGIHRETVGIWITGIAEQGLKQFLDSYEHAKKGERKGRQVDPLLKRWIWKIREEEKECCGQKIQYFLNKDYGVKPAVSKIYEILAEKYILKSKWKKNLMSGAVPVAQKAREVIQMDTIDFGEVFAFTAVDIFSREADVLLAPELTADYGYEFLKNCMHRRFNSFSNLIQTDGGPEFKERFKQHVLEYAQRHRVAHPYKKNEQSYIESFNRTVRKECLGWIKYKVREIPEMNGYVAEFLDRYHYHRPHIGCGMKPPLERS
jgi:transposase